MVREYKKGTSENQGYRLWAADSARLQAVLVAGRAPKGPIGLLESVSQHRELAAVAQRTGGNAGALAVETVILRDQPILQETSRGLQLDKSWGSCPPFSWRSKQSWVLAKTASELERMFPTDAHEGSG